MFCPWNLPAAFRLCPMNAFIIFGYRSFFLFLPHVFLPAFFPLGFDEQIILFFLREKIEIQISKSKGTKSLLMFCCMASFFSKHV